jgi:hypothetical protein
MREQFSKGSVQTIFNFHRRYFNVLMHEITRTLEANFGTHYYVELCIKDTKEGALACREWLEQRLFGHGEAW